MSIDTTDSTATSSRVAVALPVDGFSMMANQMPFGGAVEHAPRIAVGLLAPAGTPREIADKISADIRQVLALNEVKARLAELGALPVGSAPDAFAKLIASDRRRHAQIIADKNIHVD